MNEIRRQSEERPTHRLPSASTYPDTPLGGATPEIPAGSKYRLRALLLVVIVFSIHATIAVLIGTHGWDDGAITVAFARTFAETGRIALTPHSEVVEGFSSPLWMLFSAGTYEIHDFGFGNLILISQLWSALFAAIGAAILYLLLRSNLPRAALPLSFVIFVSSAFLNETANGMEMTALSALTLITVWWIHERKPSHRGSDWAVLFTVAALAPLVRFEAGGYVIVGAIAVFIARDRRRAGALLCGACASLLVLSALRLALFDSILPNTILAKRWPPYPHAHSLQEKLALSRTVINDIAVVLAPGAVVGTIALLRRRIPPCCSTLLGQSRSQRVQPGLAYILGYIAGVVGFNLAIGPNWGYPGRMEQSLVAIFVVAVVYFLAHAARSLESRGRLIAVLIVLLVLTLHGFQDRINNRWFPERADNVTSANVRQTGETLEEIRKDLELPTLSVLIPDVGGSSVCCTQLQIHDLAMLADHTLAHGGYQALGPYLMAQHPDVIETHGMWSSASGLYDLAYFRETYTPIIVRGRLFYLRKDLIGRLEKYCQPISLEQPAILHTLGADIDRLYIGALKNRKTCSFR